MRLSRIIILVALLTVATSKAAAQTFALKTNLLGYATAAFNIGPTLNLGGEVAVGKKSTVQLFGSLDPWKSDDAKHLRFWNVMPEYRHWFCQRFNGHFVGIHATGGEYDSKDIDYPCNILPDQSNCNSHYEGWYIGGGLTYGYQWILSRHWNFEASIGVGYMYSRYKEYGRCDGIQETHHRNYVGPTKAALSLMYVF